MAENALLVVDMLSDFLLPQGNLFIGKDAARVTSTVVQEVEAARASGIPVIYTNDCHPERDSEFKMFPAHCLSGTPGAKVVESLTPAAGDLVINKRTFNAFFQTDLEQALRDLGVERLRIVGVCTNICVMYTAANARLLGYRVKVPRAAVASFDRGAHEFALEQMASVLGCDVV